jgi:membrane dipeptidase
MQNNISVADLHCDSILEIQAGADIGVNNSDIHLDIPRLKKGHVKLQVFACFIPSLTPARRAFNEAVSLLALIKNTCSEKESYLKCITEYSEYSDNTDPRILVLSAVENGHAIENDLKKLETLKENGACYMTLTHSKHLAWAASSGEEYHGKDGLSSFGREVIHVMNELGMIIDVSHVHESTFWDVIRYSRRPIIASHSNARALCDTPRNLSDDQIKAVADNGGMIGINFFPGFLDQHYADYLKKHCGDLFTMLNRIEKEFLNDPPAKIKAMHDMSADLASRLEHVNITYERIIDHVEHIMNVGGDDYVGFGSDFDGVPSLPTGVHGCDIYPDIIEKMRERGLSEKTVKKIAVDNFMRVWASQI